MYQKANEHSYINLKRNIASALCQADLYRSIGPASSTPATSKSLVDEVSDVGSSPII